MDTLDTIVREYKLAENDGEITDKGKLLSNLVKITTIDRGQKNEIRRLLRKNDLHVHREYMNHPIGNLSPRSWTLVTMYFDLATFEKNGKRRTSKEYLKFGRETLSLPYDKIVYTEPRFVDEISKIHQLLRGPSAEGRLKIRSLNIEDVPTWPLYDKFKQGFINNPVRNGESYKNTPTYSCLVNAKHDFMSQVIEENPFESSHFCWVDFGLSHIVDFKSANIDYILSTAPDELKMLQMTATHISEIKNKREFYSRLRGKLGARFVTGSKDEWLRVIELYRAELEKLFALGIQGNEEQIWSCVEAENPEIFKHTYGDYDTTLSNYNCIRSKLTNVIWNLHHCIGRGMWTHASDVCDVVMDSLYSKSLVATKSEIFLFLKSAETIYIATENEDADIIGDVRAMFLGDTKTEDINVINLFVGCVLAYSSG